MAKQAAVSVDVLIPVYRPDEKLIKLLDRLQRQSCPPRRIRVINTEREYFEEFFGENGFAERYPEVELSHIRAEEYDHGGTRRALVEASDAEYFICMTDDALPLDAQLIERLLAPLLAGEAEVSYARQLPRPELGLAERYVRRYNYPAEPCIKTGAELATLGIKAFFCSNVCAAYRRSVYDELGGFPEPIIFNEDMVYARRLLDAGYRIAYAADARVLHSHSYTAYQQLRRNFDLGVSQVMHPEAFGDVRSESEGVRMLKKTAGYLLRHGQLGSIAGLVVTSGCKYVGYRLGRGYRRLPRALIRRLTLNPAFWAREAAAEKG